MLRVMLVDDEPAHLNGLVKYVKWAELGYGQPMLAESGEEALALLQAQGVDVLITDVCMPGMTGLELVEAARELLPDLRVLIVSGHEEFEFVKEALEIGVQAYLLKPLKIEEVEHRLIALKRTLDNRNQVRDETEKFKSRFEDSREIMQAQFVSELLHEHMMPPSALGRWESLLGLPLLKQGLRLAVFSLDRFFTLSDHDPRQRVVVSTAFLNAASIAFADFESAMISRVAPDQIVVLFINPSPQELARFEHQFQFVQETVAEQQHKTVTVCASRWGSDWMDAGRLYREAKLVISQARLLADGQLIMDVDAREFAEVNNQLMEYRITELWTDLNALHADKVHGILEEMFEQARGEGGDNTFSYVQALAMSVLSQLMSRNNVSPETDEQSKLLHWRRLLDCTDVAQIKQLLYEYVDDYMEECQRRQASNQNSLVLGMVQYLEEHLRDNVTVKELASVFHFNPSYVSVLFKREMNVSISDYVRNLRIARAKEMLEDPRNKIYEIGEALGFQSAAYFAYVFKKAEGCTPNEYRERLDHYGMKRMEKRED